MFTITVSAENFDDALDIYSHILRTQCRDGADAHLLCKVGERLKLLSHDNLKTGEGNAGATAEVCRLSR